MCVLVIAVVVLAQNTVLSQPSCDRITFGSAVYNLSALSGAENVAYSGGIQPSERFSFRVCSNSWCGGTVWPKVNASVCQAYTGPIGVYSSTTTFSRDDVYPNSISVHYGPGAHWEKSSSVVTIVCSPRVTGYPANVTYQYEYKGVYYFRLSHAAGCPSLLRPPPSPPPVSPPPFAVTPPPVATPGSAVLKGLSFPSFVPTQCTGSSTPIKLGLHKTCNESPTLPYAYHVSNCDNNALSLTTYPSGSNCFGQPFGNFTYAFGSCLPDIFTNNGGSFIYLGCDYGF